MTLNPNWFLNATGQFTQIGSGQISISTTTTTGFLTYLASSLSSNTLCSGNGTTGPSVAQGTSGVWYASGNVSFTDSATNNCSARLTDGTSIIDAGVSTVPAASQFASIALSGVISSPAGNIRIIATVGTTGTASLISTSNTPSPQTNLSTLTVIRIG